MFNFAVYRTKKQVRFHRLKNLGLKLYFLLLFYVLDFVDYQRIFKLKQELRLKTQILIPCFISEFRLINFINFPLRYYRNEFYPEFTINYEKDVLLPAHGDNLHLKFT